MKIAVTYRKGEVFQHFGHSEFFKVYDVEDGKIVNSMVMSTEGTGHEALAALLAKGNVKVVICGGMGDGAANALAEAGIEVVSGVTGSADEAVENYLKGNLESEGVNCDHHHGEEAEAAEAEEGCGCGCGCGGEDEEGGGGCGGGCGGCGGGCGGGMPMPMMEGPNVGKLVKVHYCGTFNDGTQFDSSYDRGEPLEFICGVGMMIPGFDRAVKDMEVGQVLNIHLMPEEAYGPADPNAVFTIQLSQLPGAEELNVGDHVYLQDANGRSIPVVVKEKGVFAITFDANHEMAGKELNFKIELLEINEQ